MNVDLRNVGCTNLMLGWRHERGWPYASNIVLARIVSPWKMVGTQGHHPCDHQYENCYNEGANELPTSNSPYLVDRQAKSFDRVD